MAEPHVSRRQFIPSLGMIDEIDESATSMYISSCIPFILHPIVYPVIFLIVHIWTYTFFICYLYIYIYRYISHENRHFPVFIQKKVTLIFPGSQHQVTLQLLDVISELKIQRLWLQPGSESQEARCCGR